MANLANFSYKSDPFAHFLAKKQLFDPQKGPVGPKRQKRIQKGPLHCWIIITNLLPPIWLYVKGPLGPKRHILRSKMVPFIIG